MDLRTVKLVRKHKLKGLKELQLEIIYQEITRLLNIHYKIETIQTKYEDYFLERLRLYTKLKAFRSVWIGSRCIDIFIPSLTGANTSENKMKGLAIELDGKVHNQYDKMIKDEHLGDYLSSLGIAHMSIENSDIRNSNIVSFLETLPSLNRLDSRARNRLWRTIHIETIRKNKDLITQLGSITSKRALEILRSIQ